MWRGGPPVAQVSAFPRSLPAMPVPLGLGEAGQFVGKPGRVQLDTIDGIVFLKHAVTLD